MIIITITMKVTMVRDSLIIAMLDSDNHDNIGEEHTYFDEYSD